MQHTSMNSNILRSSLSGNPINHIDNEIKYRERMDTNEDQVFSDGPRSDNDSDNGDEAYHYQEHSNIANRLGL